VNTSESTAISDSDKMPWPHARHHHASKASLEVVEAEAMRLWDWEETNSTCHQMSETVSEATEAQKCVLSWLSELRCKLEQLRQRNTELMSFVVLGDTGAGKSTLLNALLHESKLIPTSGMRACTASVVEIRYGLAGGGMSFAAEEGGGTVKYKAEITFISRAELFS